MLFPRLVLAFDTETAPDWELLSKLSGIPVDEKEPLEDWLADDLRNRTIPKIMYNEIHSLSITCLARGSLDSVFTLDGDEAENLKMFDELLGEDYPTVMSWNGLGFDLPVMVARALKLGVPMPNLLNKQDKWDNYSSRGSTRHLDIMQEMAQYQFGNFTSMHVAAVACGLPGKVGISGGSVSKDTDGNELDTVRQAISEGRTRIVDDYCEIDTITTALLGTRYYRLRGGKLSVVRDVTDSLTDFLTENRDGNQFFDQYLQGWDRSAWR